MAEKYFPFDAGDGASVAEADWSAMARLWADSGVVDVPEGPGLLVTAGAGLQVRVAAGAAWLQGFYYGADAAQTVDVDANATGATRIDRVVVRLDRDADNVALAVVAGTPGGGVPALTRTDTVWEIPLATVTVAPGASSIGAADVHSEREFTGQKVIPCTGPTRPAHRKGLVIYDSGAKALLVSDGAAWLALSRDGHTHAESQVINLRGDLDGLAAGVAARALTSHAHTGTDGTGRLRQEHTHQASDTNSSAGAIHHTLGRGSTQAAPGDHGHAQGDVSGLGAALGALLPKNGALAFGGSSTPLAGPTNWTLSQHPLIFKIIEEIVTTDGTGHAVINFPGGPFPNGVLTVLPASGDNQAALIVSRAEDWRATTKSSFAVYVAQQPAGSGTAIVGKHGGKTRVVGVAVGF